MTKLFLALTPSQLLDWVINSRAGLSHILFTERAAYSTLAETRTPHFNNIAQRNMREKTNPTATLDEITDKKKMVSDELALNYCLISIIMHVNSISNELQLSGGRKHL